MNVDLMFLFFQIRFFHKLGSMPTPVTDTEKLIWAVLEAERPTFRFSWKCFCYHEFLIKIVVMAHYTYVIFTAVNCMRNLLWRQTLFS